jgi:predicted dehydrogenase
VIGAGTISDEYLRNLTSFPDLKVLAIGDIDTQRAGAQADKYGLPLSGGVDVVLDHPDVEIVVNLTIPAAHVEVSTAILEAGKHVWTEKALALDRAGGSALRDLAAERNLRIGCATDTFLGVGLQTAQRLLAAGTIGRPVSAITMMQDPGPESWHPGPEFLYAAGAGPLWDRGPYYLSMLTQFFGPMRRVAAVSTKAFQERTVQVGPRAGAVFPVEVPTNVGALIQFDDGVVSQSTYSYESPVIRMGWVEISGTEATMAVPDPSMFSGDIFIYPTRRWTLEELIETGDKEPPKSDWRRIATGAWRASRGSGTLDLARSIRAGVPHRASVELGYHVLDAMIAIGEAAERGTFVAIESTVSAIEPLPPGWDPYAATL